MSFFQNKRNLIIIAVLFFILPIIFSLLVSKYDQFEKGRSSRKTSSSLPVNIALPSYPPAQVDLTKDLLTCPTVKNFCQNSQEVRQNNVYQGIGDNIAKGTPIYAAFDGDLTYLSGKIATASASENILIMYVDNKAKGLRAVYTLKGQAVDPRKVREGEPIAIVGDKINLFGVSFIFKLVTGNPINGESVKLSPANFKK